MDSSTSWILGSSILKTSLVDDEDEDDTVDVECIDSSLRASNRHNFHSVAYVSIMGTFCFVDKTGRPILFGTTSLEFEDKHVKVGCLTFVLILKPFECISFCKSMDEKISMDDLHIDTLSFRLKSHPDPKGTLQPAVPKLECFPLKRREVSERFVCTQGFGGRLTHFFPESYHAVDFRCDLGTEVVAVANGVITDVTQNCKVSGIHCGNLSRWNSISLKMDNGFTADYVRRIYIISHNLFYVMQQEIPPTQPTGAYNAELIKS